MRDKILVGDIGGTNSRVGIVENNKILSAKKFPTTKENLEKHLKEYIKKYKIKGVCLACAGPKNENQIKLTNNDLILNKKRLKKKLGKEVILINDFEALGYYAKYKKVKKGLVIGAGTGLGKVFVDKNVTSSEGGEVEIPFKLKEKEYQEYFTKKCKKAPTYECLVSGNGLINLKKFHSKKKLKKTEIEPENIFLNKKEKTNEKTIRDFSKFLGRFIKNSYIDFNCEKILLAGGIIKKHPWIIKNKEFVEELKQDFMKQPKITIIKEKHPALVGAYVAYKELKK